MKAPCYVIEDLMLLYQEGLCSEQSRELVDEHLRGCEFCRAKFDAMCAPEPVLPKRSAAEEARVLKQIRRKLKQKLIKAAAIGLAAAFLVGICAMFVSEYRHSQGMIIAEAESAVYDVFSYQNTVYKLGRGTAQGALSLSVQFCSVLMPQGNGQESSTKNYTILPDASAQWCEEAECIVYTSGKKIYTCGPDGKGKEKIFTVPYCQYAIIDGIFGEYVVVHGTNSSSYNMVIGVHYYYVYYVLNLLTGEAIETNVSAYLGQATPLCVADGVLYYCTKKSSYYEIVCYGLENYRWETLATGSTNEIDWQGFVIGGYLYYCLYGSIYRVPTAGGEVEALPIDFSSLEAGGAAGMVEYQGRLLIACVGSGPSGETTKVLRILSYDPDTDAWNVLFTEPVIDNYSVEQMRLSDGSLVVLGWDNQALFFPLD